MTLKSELDALEAMRLRAEQKVDRQSKIVARLNGSADQHPEEQHLLGEMRQNQAVIKLNQSLLEFGKDDDAPSQPR